VNDGNSRTLVVAGELAIVLPPALGIGQHVESLTYFLKRARGLLARHVRMEPLGEVAVPSSDAGGALGAGDTENHVVRLPLHGVDAVLT
jgi:hypothetical protein